MKANKVKRALEHGGVAMGTMMLEFNTTGIARIAAEAGSEFAVFDMEHTGWSMETIRMLMASAAGAEIVPMVRVPTLQYHFISRILDVGAMGSSFRSSRAKNKLDRSSAMRNTLPMDAAASPLQWPTTATAGETW